MPLAGNASSIRVSASLTAMRALLSGQWSVPMRVGQLDAAAAPVSIYLNLGFSIRLTPLLFDANLLMEL